MPVLVTTQLQALRALRKEGIPVLVGGTGNQAYVGQHQKLRVAVVNLMPDKKQTETHLLRVLSHPSLLVEVVFVRLVTHHPRNTDVAYLKSNYHTLADLKGQYLDGMIITGAPLEQVPFEQVDYWAELQQIMDYARYNVNSTLFICWGVLAALYHYYGLPKHLTDRKIFGVYPHNYQEEEKLFAGFKRPFWVPHSRYFTLQHSNLSHVSDIDVVAHSLETGIYVARSIGGRQVYVTGHLEYDPLTLHNEYQRDLQRGLNINLPKHYYPHDNPQETPRSSWQAEGKLFYGNWLKHYVASKQQQESIKGVIR